MKAKTNNEGNEDTPTWSVEEEIASLSEHRGLMKRTVEQVLYYGRREIHRLSGPTARQSLVELRDKFNRTGYVPPPESPKPARVVADGVSLSRLANHPQGKCLF